MRGAVSRVVGISLSEVVERTSRWARMSSRRRGTLRVAKLAG